MPKVRVYYFEKFDPHLTWKTGRSREMGTLKAIRTAQGKPLMETALEVDEAELTENGFYRPKP